MAISTEVRGARANPELRTRTNQVLEKTAQQRPNLPPELQNDRTRLSDELLDEVDKAMQTQPSTDMDSLLSAVTENFMNRKAEEAAPAQGDEEKRKKVDIEWAPEVRPGQLMAPQGYTGQLIYRESKDPSPEGAVQPTGASGKKSKATRTGNRPGPVSRTPNAGKPGGSPDSKGGSQAKAQDQKPGDTVELTAEGQKTAEKLKNGGMKSAGLDKAANSQGGKPEERVDVFMPAAGVTQIVEVRPGGQLAADGVLGTYRKLDDMPAFNGAILRKHTGKELVNELREKQKQGEKVPELTADQVDKLRNPVATEK